MILNILNKAYPVSHNIVYCIGVLFHCIASGCIALYCITVKILKIGTPEIITINVLQLEQLDFTVQYCVQKMQTE